MSALEAAVLVAILVLPWHLLVQREIAKLTDPAYLRMHGVVILNQSVLQDSAPIGEYLGHPIWASVRFMGMEYRFDRVQRAGLRERVGPRELYLEPGLVYITA